MRTRRGLGKARNLVQDISRGGADQCATHTCARTKYPARIGVCVHSARELALQIVSHCRLRAPNFSPRATLLPHLNVVRAGASSLHFSPFGMPTPVHQPLSSPSYAHRSSMNCDPIPTPQCVTAFTPVAALLLHQLAHPAPPHSCRFRRFALGSRLSLTMAPLPPSTRHSTPPSTPPYRNTPSLQLRISFPLPSRQSGALRHTCLPPQDQSL